MKFYCQNKVDNKTININASTIYTLVMWLYCMYFQLHERLQLLGCLENGVITLAIVKYEECQFKV